MCDGRCGLAACANFARRVRRALQIGFGETTRDGLVRLSTLRCPERPTYAAIAMLDDERYLIVEPHDLDRVIGEATARAA